MRDKLKGERCQMHSEKAPTSFTSTQVKRASHLMCTSNVTDSLPSSGFNRYGLAGQGGSGTMSFDKSSESSESART